MSMIIKNPGFFTTVQDSGRRGHMAEGIRTAGVMDRRAYRWANLLAGNEEDCAVLEFMLTGPTVEFTEPCLIALTGAGFAVRVNGNPVPMAVPVFVQKGDILETGSASDGVYGYLSVRGGIDVPRVMGSRSTDVRCGIGGFRGRTLESGDIIDIGRPKKDLLPLGGIGRDSRENPIEFGTAFFRKEHEPARIRVILGPQAEAFTEEGKRDFLSSVYTVTDRSDRMGVRLKGKAVQTVHGSDIISDGIPLGAIQVTSDGMPIVLLSDRQTTGGYAKIAVIASCDLSRFVQLGAGAEVRFEEIGVSEAQALLKKENGFFNELKKGDGWKMRIQSAVSSEKEGRTGGEKEEGDENGFDPGEYFTAPVSGTFYLSGDPGSDDLTKQGDQVSPGRELFIIEAMKMMHTVTADRNFTVCEVLKRSGEKVRKGEPVFRIRG